MMEEVKLIILKLGGQLNLINGAMKVLKPAC